VVGPTQHRSAPLYHIPVIAEEAEVLALAKEAGIFPSPSVGSGLDEFACGVVVEFVSHNMYLSFICVYIIPHFELKVNDKTGTKM
jgi:hypothetical protein